MTTQLPTDEQIKPILEHVEEAYDQNLEVAIEYRVVCASFGEPGHHDHSWAKENPALVERYRQKKDRELAGQKMAPLEVPHRIQTRAISDWRDV